MLTAGQIEATGHGTNVIDVDAALLVALVSAAATLLDAPFPASCIVGTRGQLGAFHFLVHVAAAALHTGLFIAGRTLADVAFAHAHVRTAGLAAGQWFLANVGAQRNGIFA